MKNEQCNHNFQHIGHNSHYDYEQCTLCGEIRTV